MHNSSYIICLYFTAEISVVICDNNTKVKNLLSRHKETPGLKTIVMMEEANDENSTLADKLGIHLLKFTVLLVSY